MEYDDNCLYINKVHGMIFWNYLYEDFIPEDSRDGFSF